MVGIAFLAESQQAYQKLTAMNPYYFQDALRKSDNHMASVFAHIWGLFSVGH